MKSCSIITRLLTTTLIVAMIASCSPSNNHYNSESREVDILYLWSLVRHGSQAITEDLTIKGTIVANDKLNELNKSIVVVDQSGGIEIAIECDRIESELHLFSQVEVRLSGLHIGRVGDKCVVGKAPTGEYVVDRIAQKDIYLYITPTLDYWAPHTRDLSIGELGKQHLLNYVHINDVHFIDEEQGKRWCEIDSLTQRYVTTIRHLTDGVDTLQVVVDKECRYSSALLPHWDVSCYGIVDYSNRDIALRISDNQIFRDE